MSVRNNNIKTIHLMIPKDTCSGYLDNPDGVYRYLEGGCIGARHPVLQNCDSHTTMTRALSKTSRGYDFHIQDTTIYRLNLK